MTKEKAIKVFNKLNKIINGSNQVISAIDTFDPEKKPSQNKINKLSMLNSKLLAESLKEILKDIVESSKDSNDSGSVEDMLKTIMRNK